MVTKNEYKEYFGVGTVPSNFDRLLYLSIQELRSIMTENVPTSDELIYEDFKKAIMEQINFFDINGDLIDSIIGSGASLGSYHEGSNSNSNSNSKSINRTSPMAYNILLNIGLVCSSLGRC